MLRIIHFVITNIISFIILLGLFVGRYYRRQRVLHIRIMSTAIICDIVLVLYLALARDVLSKINTRMSWLLIVHVAMALTVVLCYFFAIYFGIHLARGDESMRPKMRLMDKFIMPLRVLVFVTSMILVFARK